MVTVQLLIASIDLPPGSRQRLWRVMLQADLTMQCSCQGLLKLLPVGLLRLLFRLMRSLPLLRMMRWLLMLLLRLLLLPLLRPPSSLLVLLLNLLLVLPPLSCGSLLLPLLSLLWSLLLPLKGC